MLDAWDRRYLAWLVVVVAATHGLLSINTGYYWDDYVVCDFIEHDWTRLYELGDKLGNLGLAVLYAPFRFLGDACASMKVAVLLCLIATAALIYVIARHIGITDRFAAFFIAAAGVIYPGHMMTFAANIAGHFFCYFAFALGALFALQSASRTGKSRVAYRLAAYVAFVVSYFTASFLALHFGFLLLLFVHTAEIGVRGLVRSAVHFLTRNVDLVVLPFAYWIIKEQVNPVHGWGLQWAYNEVRIDPDRMLVVYGNLLRIVAHSWLYYFEKFVACVAGLSLLLCLARKISPPVARVLEESRMSARSALLAVAFGLVCLVVGAFPYAAVGKMFGAPAVVDWSTRNQLLLQLPLAIFVLGVATLAFGRWSEVRISALLTALLFSAAIRIDTYLQWQAQAIKDESVRHHLAQQAGRYHLLIFHNRYVVVESREFFNDTVYWWAFALKLAFGDLTRFGLYYRDEREALTARRYTAGDVAATRLRDRGHPGQLDPPQFDPAAPQAAVIIDRGPRAGIYSLIVPYYLAKVQGGDALRQFLAGVTRISLTDLR